MLTVVLGACVLHPAPLRDVLMRLATNDVFRARWSDAIHEGWIASVLRQRPELPTQVSRTRALMNAHVMDCLVSGYEGLVDTLILPDPGDRHVLAAAIACGATGIVTWNLKDFPKHLLAPWGITALHPDAFIGGLLQRHEAAVLAAMEAHRAALRRPPKSVAEYLETLLKQGLSETVAPLRVLWRS